MATAVLGGSEILIAPYGCECTISQTSFCSPPPTPQPTTLPTTGPTNSPSTSPTNNCQKQLDTCSVKCNGKTKTNTCSTCECEQSAYLTPVIIVGCLIVALIGLCICFMSPKNTKTYYTTTRTYCCSCITQNN